MNDLSETLSTFTPISLAEMDHVKLLNRIDTKFVIHGSELIGFLNVLAADYKLLTIDDKPIQPYETLYYDTPGFKLYQMHHNGRRNRYKLRCRKYVNSGISFFEIKSKTNTRRTIKKRMQIDSIPQILTEPLNQYIRENTPGEFQNYVPSLEVFFERLTLVNKHASERLTFDMNLSYKNESGEKKIDDIIIVEVKQEKHCISPYRELMKRHRHPENYLSKYCLGVTSLNCTLKKNRFKQKFRTLNKLGYDI